MSAPSGAAAPDAAPSDHGHPAGAASAAPVPLVSVIMPVHNGAAFIDEAIASIRTQTLHAWELLVIDDGSSDDSAARVQRHAAQDARIRLIHQPKQGVAFALNRGMHEARAPWMARMDCDDVSLPTRLERTLHALQADPGLAAVGAWATLIGAGGRAVGERRSGPTTPEAFAVQRERGPLQLISSTVIVSRELALALGGHRQEYAPAEDADFFTRIADAHQLLVLPEPLLRYRIHSRSASTQGFALQMEQTRRIAANMRRRRAGQPELTRDTFRALERQAGWQQRTARSLQARSRGYYRHGAALLADGRPLGAGWLLLSALCYPAEPWKRLRRVGLWQTLRARSGRSAPSGRSDQQQQVGQPAGGSRPPTLDQAAE